MRVIRTFGIATLIAVALVGCGSKSKASKSTTTAAPTTSSASTTTGSGSTSGSVDIATTSLGKVLVDSTGKTLYMTDADTSTKSNCNGSCASSWPPLTGSVTAGTGVDASKLSTITRSDGTKQLAYNGHPLYTWTGDSQAGDTTGQGISGFFVISSEGSKIS